MRRPIITALAFLAIVVGVAVVSPQPASASGGCWTGGVVTSRQLTNGTYWVRVIPASGRLDQLPYTERTAANAENYLTCSLVQGNSGYAVKILQLALKECYGRNIAIDGQFGPNTRAALVYAQGQESIQADGQFGPQTRNALKWSITTASDNSAIHSSAHCQHLEVFEPLHSGKYPYPEATYYSPPPTLP